MKKNHFVFTLIGILLATLLSCSSHQTFTVKGTPGTIITNPNNLQIGTIGNTGETKLTLSRKDGYYHYLQAYVPGSSVIVPFALDYQNKKNVVRDFYNGLGVGLMGIGIIAEFAAIPMVAQDSEDNSSIGMLAGGIATTLFGMGIYGLTNYKGGRIKHEYDYQKLQITNTDAVSAQPQLSNIEYKTSDVEKSTAMNPQNEMVEDSSSDTELSDDEADGGWWEFLLGDEDQEYGSTTSNSCSISFDYFKNASGTMIEGKYEFCIQFENDVINFKVTSQKKGSTTTNTVYDFHIQELSYSIEDDWIMIGFKETNKMHAFLFQKNYFKPTEYVEENLSTAKRTITSFRNVVNEKDAESSLLTTMLFGTNPSEIFYKQLKELLTSYKGNCNVKDSKGTKS